MFITLEGMEGAGKSTLASGLAARFQKRGREVVLTREPGGCSLGRTLRTVLLDVGTKIASETELFLFLADRAQHVAEVIRPALERGCVVISDRYADSTIVYQGYGRGMDRSELCHLNHIAMHGLWPDKTFVLDLDPEVGLRRALQRNESLGAAASEGRFESEQLAFHVRVREGFLDWAHQNSRRCIVLDAAQPAEQLLDAAWTALGED